ncbi:unnamed protein product, partial [Trichogramma brassicae]
MSVAIGRWHAVRCVMPGVAVVHFSPSRVGPSRPLGVGQRARSVTVAQLSRVSRHGHFSWCFPVPTARR